ncbi:cupredoxin domain-containing protein [Eoetvoesiella caeni]|uniref:Cupredoxin-like protein n=1 Tax=Eoetvoesiella caeni TaxID=645616 RepID=A0A366H7K6_9BURK|nr:cupredoxin domain-containing protein [Eoetvoesiella caeni]MCI2809996.1 cupredoxin domain-containing protein [Eoetvoesiella caeni]NYT55872.1 cupredoxin domain-containing protein [Eoetvoesiella caeni]RBP37517.1 cupredoxin-like protein [Eoetvoesiella caeni]
MRWVKCALLALSLALGGGGLAQADELPTYTLTFKQGGSFEPERLEVPAGRFKLILVNESNEPVEFESLPLRKEKVLGPGVTSFVVIKISRPGQYPFFDDFHQDTKGTLVVLDK